MSRESAEAFRTVAVYEDTIQRSIHEHEILLVFVNDDDAYEFRQWMGTEGEAAFLAFLKSEREND